MISWQKILREETFSSDFELVQDNDKFIIDGVKTSYKSKLTARDDQIKDILDGAFKAGFKLAKRRYSSKVVYVLIKSYRNAHTIFQFSIQPKTLLACEVAYGISGEELYPTAKKSRYFTTIYDKFDKTLPLEFMDVNVDKEQLEERVHVPVQDEYEWSEYFDYVYSFMIVMLEKLNEEGVEMFLEESEKVVADVEDDIDVSDLTNTLNSFNSNIRVEVKNNRIKKECVVFVDWDKDYKDQSDDVKNKLNTIITDFCDSVSPVAKVDIERGRFTSKFTRTIFIKY